MSRASLIPCDSYSDARGVVRFCNDFDMSAVKRFYTIANSVAEPKRGWIMHKRETKWFFPMTGVTKVEVEGIGEVEGLGRDRGRTVFVLNAVEPAVLCVPPGNWFMIEQVGKAEVQVFSNCLIGEFKDDDFRRLL